MVNEPLEAGLLGGAERRDIKIVDYNPDWPKRFEAHAKTIAGALGRLEVSASPV
jgi:GrpB-like predicted nucleotidyltransferase (UPF0157 family)